MKQRTVIFTIITTITLLALISLSALAQTPSEAIEEGNQLYEAGNYDEAAQTYQQAIDAGIQNAALYYNLGNVYFKQGDVGRAILNYRRAGRLTPRDPDARANLALAQAQTADQIEATSLDPLGELVSFSQYWFTLNELAIITLGLWLLFTVLVVLYTHIQGRRGQNVLQYVLVFFGLLLIAGAIALGSRLFFEAKRPSGVIVALQTNITSGPGEQYITEFTLSSGTEVNIIDRREHWLRIVVPGGNLQGWAPDSSVGLVQTE